MPKRKPLFPRRWLEEGLDPESLPEHCVDFDRWDREDLQHTLKDIPAFAAARDKLQEFVETGKPAMSDLFWMLLKADPHLVENVRPSHLNNLAVARQMEELNEYEQARLYTVNDDVSAALAASNSEPTLETLFDRTERTTESAMEFEQRLADLFRANQDVSQIEYDIDDLIQKWGGPPPEPPEQCPDCGKNMPPKDETPPEEEDESDEGEGDEESEDEEKPEGEGDESEDGDATGEGEGDEAGDGEGQTEEEGEGDGEGSGDTEEGQDGAGDAEGEGEGEGAPEGQGEGQGAAEDGDPSEEEGKGEGQGEGEGEGEGEGQGSGQGSGQCPTCGQHDDDQPGEGEGGEGQGQGSGQGQGQSNTAGPQQGGAGGGGGGTPRPEHLPDEVKDKLDELAKNLREAQERQEAAREAAEQAGEDFEQAQEKGAAGTRSALSGMLRDLVDQAKLERETAMTWGVDPGELQRLPADQRIALAKRLNNDRFKRIAALFGPMKNMMLSEQQRRTTHTREEIYDVELGDDLARILPSEAANLHHPILRKEFKRKLAEKSLMQYAMQGEEKLARGGIIFCEDGSGSMAGEREMWAKAVMLCLLHLARQQKRPFHAIHFGSRGQIRHIPFVEEKDFALERILETAELFFNGGTDFVTPMEKAMQILEDEHSRLGFTRADVVFCTDDECWVDETFMKSYLDCMDRLQSTTWGISVGGGGRREGALDTMSEGKVALVSDFLSGGEIRHIFRGV